MCGTVTDVGSIRSHVPLIAVNVCEFHQSFLLGPSQYIVTHTGWMDGSMGILSSIISTVIMGSPLRHVGCFKNKLQKYFDPNCELMQM